MPLLNPRRRVTSSCRNATSHRSTSAGSTASGSPGGAGGTTACFPVTGGFHGQHFFVREVGRIHATPLFICLLFLEMTDILFAVDSVPAIFGLTREPFVVFTSNVFAILGLRNLYFLLAGAVDKFHFLKYGLGVVLVFVGLKMTVLNHLWQGHFPITWSLAFIVAVIAVSITLSLLFPKPDQEAPSPHGD